MSAFAEKTSVSVARSKAEIEELLKRRGASRYLVGADDKTREAFVYFALDARHFRLAIPLPAPPKVIEGQEPHGWKRWSEQRRGDWLYRRQEQEERTRWRAVVLLLKAKLEAVAIGVSTIEREFLADLVLPDGGTLYGRLSATIETAYLDGRTPPLLLGLGPA